MLAQACRAIGLTNLTSVDLFTGTPDWGQTFDTHADASRRMKEFGVADFVRLVRGDSRTVPWSAPIDVLHIDGDHSLEAVRSDIQRFVPHIGRHGIVIFDDYDTSHSGVMNAVDEFLTRNEAFQILERHDAGPAGGSLCVGRR